MSYNILKTFFISDFVAHFDIWNTLKKKIIFKKIFFFRSIRVGFLAKMEKKIFSRLFQISKCDEKSLIKNTTKFL